MHESSENNFMALLQAHLTHMAANGFAERTRRARKLFVLRFFRWALDFGLRSLADVGRQSIESYQKFITRSADKSGQPWSFEYQNRHILALKHFFAYLSEKNRILTNPARGVLLARVPKVLPAILLTPQSAERLFSLADTSTPLGLRDRAMMEVFYATGIRRGELCLLKLADINGEDKTLFIRQAKGNKDRLVPISQRALHWLAEYRNHGRDQLLAGESSARVFISSTGKSIIPETLSTLFNSYFKKAGFPKGSCHVFRHSLATIMMECGIDTRYIQTMLGHENLFTTQRYTHVSIGALKDVHTRTHPLAE